MTKEQMINWLEEIIQRKRIINSEGATMLTAASLLAELRGWKISYCRKTKSVCNPMRGTDSP